MRSPMLAFCNVRLRYQSIRRGHERLTMRLGVIAIIALAAACVLAVFGARAVPSVLAQSAPGSVGTITVTRGDGALTASWDAVNGATKYHITYSTDNRASWHAPVDGHRNWASSSITFDADNSKTYIIGVRAGNAYGWSGWNNSAPSGPHTPELAPTPTSTPTPTPTSTPEPTPTSTPTPTPKPTSTPTPTPTPKPKPAPTHTPTPTPELPPAAVGAITVTRADGTITASWDTVSGATKYHITYSTDNRASWHAPVNGHRNWLSNSLTFDADNAKTYIIGARAGNGAGWSGWNNSAPSAPHTPEPTPTPTPIPVTISVTDVTATTATITIGNYSGEWHYRAERQDGDGAGGASAASAAVGASGQAGGLGCAGPVNGSETAISGNDPNSTLDPNSRYIINAYQGENCAGAAMASGSFQTLSSAIAAPSPATVYRGLDFLDVEWTAVSGATGYDIMYNDDYTGPWQTAATGVTTTSHKITDTLNNKPYIVAVRAVKGQDKSTWTNSPINYPAADPLPAGSVTVTRADGQISVSWTQCDVTDENCSGHTPITQYLIRLSDNGGTNWTTAKTLTAYTSQSVQVITSTTENGTADIVNAKSYIVSVGIKNRVATKWANVSVGPWPAPGDRDSSKEFDTNAAQYGIWSDGTTMYVHWYSWELMKGGVQAYSLATGSRDSGKEFSLHSNNDRTEGMWSDGTTMWVSDWTDDKLYAYNLSTKSYDGSKDISLHADNGDATAIWSDGTTMWVADLIDDKLYAYKVSDKSRDASKDFNTLSAAGNNGPYGIWSDGATMWVSDNDDGKLYAYKMSDKSRDSSKDYELHSDDDDPIGIWSDSVTMYVADRTDGKIYAYYAFPRPQKPAAPASVTVTRGVNFLDVSWRAAAGATGYDIRYSSDGKRTWSSAATGATGSSYRITGISISKSYMVAVRATNGAGSSGWTNSAVNWKPVAPWRAESIAVTRTNGALNINWTQCDAAMESCHGGLPITGYLINISSDNGANYTRAKTLTSYTSGSAVSITSTVENGAADIVNSQSYIVSVGIQNGVGVTWANATVGPYSP